MAKHCNHASCKQRCSINRVAWNKGNSTPSDVRDKISARMKGKNLGNQNGFTTGQEPWNKGNGTYMAGENNSFYGKTHSSETRQKMSTRARGRTPWNKGLKGVQSGWSKGLTKETSKEVAQAAKTRQRRLQAGEIQFGGKDNPSRLSWKLVNFLIQAGFDKIVVEERFGPYSVDVLLLDEWLAFEADGIYWHEVNQTNYEARDAWLFQEHGLQTVRMTEDEIGRFANLSTTA